MNDGWVKVTDPNTGKAFYANKFTRQTQWDEPPDFIDPAAPAPASASASGASSGYGSSNKFGGKSNLYRNGNGNSHDNEDDLSLPSNWERMEDKASGKYFYVDHVNKVTTWEHPGKKLGEYGDSSRASHPNSFANNYDNGGQNKASGTATGFGFIPASASTASSSTYGQSKPKPKPKAQPSYTSSAVSPWASASNPSSTAQSSSYSSHSYSYKPSNSPDDASSKYYSKSSNLPNSEFTVIKVPDSLRSFCPSCTQPFTMSKRRHHCRLCGDIFCDTCSSHRAVLPLGGNEFEKPVRVCGECHVDVERGNFFSMRRYLTPLLLYDYNEEEKMGRASGYHLTKNDDGSAVEVMDGSNVAAALTSLAQDLDSIITDSEGALTEESFHEKVSIPANVLVPAITRHLVSRETSDRGVRALANLLSLANVVGDNSFVSTVYFQENAEGVMESLCDLLEWSGSSLQTLAVQEQAARAIFYLTDGRVVKGIMEVEEASNMARGGWADSAVMICDVPRVLRSMLDHTTQSQSPSLQRWAAACVRNLIGEDHRRACEAVSEAMSTGMSEFRYTSFCVELVSSGGVMILSSLVASDDADTRAHAMAALSQIIDTARELNVRLGVFIEAYQVQNIQTCSETAIVEAVVSSGACGPSLAQLLLSADNSSASMACNFARSLVYPIISNPLGSSVPKYHRLFSSSANLTVDDDGLREYRQAALDIGASDGVLGALVHLVNDSYSAGATRPMELRRNAMEILAAVCLTLAYWDSKIKNCGKSIETLGEQILQLQEKLGMALTTLEEEQAGVVVLAAFSSTSANSLNTSRDSASSQLKEAAALIMSSLSSCSPVMADLFISGHIVTSLISMASDEGLDSPSLRGTWSSRRLPMLEAVASILVHGWHSMQREGTSRMLEREVGSGMSMNTMGGGSKPLELLLEALDAGLVPLISRILESRQEFKASDKGYADTRTRIAICHCIAAIFGIGRGDAATIGFSRIFEAMGNNHRVIPQTLYLLGSILPEVQNNASQGKNIEKDIPLLKLLEANLLAAGSICGSEFCSFGSMDVHGEYAVSQGLGTKEENVFSTQFQEICSSASEIISKNSFLPSALVGAFGEGAVMPTLRLVSTVAQNGSSKRVHQQFVRSGVLLPLTDMLRDAMNVGDYYIFDACVGTIGHVGPMMNSSSENNSIRALRDCVKLFSNILAIDAKSDTPNIEKLTGLKKKCISAVEMLSTNPSLWTVIVAHFVPGFMEHWLTCDRIDDYNPENQALVCAGLQTILRVISLPTHAVFIANTGIAAGLSNIICKQKDPSSADGGKIEGLSIQILHVLLSYSGKKGPPTERIEPGIVDIYALDVACFLLSRDIHHDHNIAMSNTKLGLEILLSMLVGLHGIERSSLSQSPRIIGFVETISSNREFLRKLCATLLCTDFERKDTSLPDLEVESLYGSPLLLFEGACGPFKKSADAAVHVLFWIAFYSTIAHTQSSGVLWDVFMLDGADISDPAVKYRTISAASANFLSCISNEQAGVCLPANKSYQQYYQQTALPIVREGLLRVLATGSGGYISHLDDDDNQYLTNFQTLLDFYRVPQICLELASNPLLMEQSFEVLESALMGFPLSLLESVVSEKRSLASILNLLSLTESKQDVDRDVVGKIRVFSAAILSSAGELNILGPSVNRLGLRSFAVASLSAACLMDDHNSASCLAEDLTEEGSSMSTLCLHGLVDVLSSDSGKNLSQIMLSSSEAQAISSGLGKKLSSMVLERFMHKAEREDILGEVSDGGAIRKFPEVTLLCALASSKDALSQLCSNGGLEALSLVAGEGELSAINALKEACKVDPEMVIAVDGHISALHVVAGDSTFSASAKSGCFELLIAIATKSQTGRTAIGNSDECLPCIEYGSDSISGLAEQCTKGDSDESTETKNENTTEPSYQIELAAMSFLSCIASNQNCRNVILGNESLGSSIEILAKDAKSYEVQQAAILFLGTCAKYIQQNDQDASGSVQRISETMLLIVNSSQLRRKSRELASSSGLSSYGNFTKSHQFNENLILASACRVIECLLPLMPQDLVSKTLTSLSNAWADTMSFQTLSLKKTKSKTSNSGILMFNISSIFLLSVGRSVTQELIKSSDIVANVLRLFLFDLSQMEKKTKHIELDEAMAKDKIHWQGALTQSLQCIAVLSMNPVLRTNDGKSWEELVSDVESNTTSNSSSKMRAFAFSKQPAAPTRNLKLSLEHVTANASSNPAGAIAASRIIENLFG